MSWAIPLAVLVVLVLLAMRKRKMTLTQRVAALESIFADNEYLKFAKCWESNFLGLGVVFRMERTLVQVCERHNQTVEACEVAKKKIVEMAVSISALTDENAELLKREHDYVELLQRSQRQAERITQLEAEARVLEGRNDELQSSLVAANNRIQQYSLKILSVREIVNK